MDSLIVDHSTLVGIDCHDGTEALWRRHMSARQSTCRVSSAFDPIEGKHESVAVLHLFGSSRCNDDTVTDVSRCVAHAQSQAGKNTATRRSVLHL